MKKFVLSLFALLLLLVPMDAVANPLVIVTKSIPNIPKATLWRYPLQAAGGVTPYTWSETGKLPVGVKFTDAGVLTGETSDMGSYPIRVTVKGEPQGTSGAQSATATFTVKVVPRGLSITTSAVLPSTTENVAYGPVAITVTGGTPSYKWAVASGSNLPSGLSLTTNDSGQGVISGTPTTFGNAVFNLTVTDSSSPAQTLTQTFNLSIAASVLTITTTSLPQLQVGTAMSITLQATGGVAPYTWTVTSGTLPDGLALSAAGILSGTPTTAQSYSFTIDVTDSAGPLMKQRARMVVGAPKTIKN